MGQETFLGYIDFMYSREGIDSKGLISEVTAVNGEGTTVPNVDYFTTIFNLDYRVASHWNMYVKESMNRAMCSSRMTCFRQVPIAGYGTYSFVQNTIL